ncbi:hypothetical protein GCM10010082_21880 [Kushneria pakistanensis]|uniref:Uncharacterized protein n=1 Tax=Kushneria pakistanensis TaxID=1508770 RepID=A0ABQ3FLB9_9GAMM|nr:hypothetical protein [Kushneria pakistanensis]GHC28192.1 hypothetical protein GCM10010082_21880 [Kushneria pakistanensis]
MTDSDFYTSAMAGLPSLIERWLEIGETTPAKLGIILADTARIARLGDPAHDPDGDTLKRWAAPASRADHPPTWATRSALFLLSQMPAHPLPRTPSQCDGWAWAWVRLRPWESLEQAREALPAWLAPALEERLPHAWQDYSAQRLV